MVTDVLNRSPMLLESGRCSSRSSGGGGGGLIPVGGDGGVGDGGTRGGGVVVVAAAAAAAAMSSTVSSSSSSTSPLPSVTINGNYLHANGAPASALAKPNLVTVVKVGNPGPAWADDARSLTSFQTFPRASHSRTTSSSDASFDATASNSNSIVALGIPAPLNPLSGPDKRGNSPPVTPAGAASIPDGCGSVLTPPLPPSASVSAATPPSSSVSILTVLIPLGNGDRRFGFSVIGGIDERFAPKIEAINAGSPADRADVRVGDEILEVNGRSLAQCTHTEVISHIHQCIRARCIQLRLQRRSPAVAPAGAPLASSSNNIKSPLTNGISGTAPASGSSTREQSTGPQLALGNVNSSSSTNINNNTNSSSINNNSSGNNNGSKSGNNNADSNHINNNNNVLVSNGPSSNNNNNSVNNNSNNNGSLYPLPAPPSLPSLPLPALASQHHQASSALIHESNRNSSKPFDELLLPAGIDVPPPPLGFASDDLPSPQQLPSSSSSSTVTPVGVVAGGVATVGSISAAPTSAAAAATVVSSGPGHLVASQQNQLYRASSQLHQQQQHQLQQQQQQHQLQQQQQQQQHQLQQQQQQQQEHFGSGPTSTTNTTTAEVGAGRSSNGSLGGGPMPATATTLVSGPVTAQVPQHNIQHSIDDNCAVPPLAPLTPPASGSGSFAQSAAATTTTTTLSTAAASTAAGVAGATHCKANLAGPELHGVGSPVHVALVNNNNNNNNNCSSSNNNNNNNNSNNNPVIALSSSSSSSSSSLSSASLLVVNNTSTTNTEQRGLAPSNGAKPVPPPLAMPIPSPRRASEKLLNRPVITKVETPQSPLYKNFQGTLDAQGPPHSPLAKSFSSPPQSPLSTVAPLLPLDAPAALGAQLIPLSLAPTPPRPTLELSSGAHREMAVDVPDAFVPIAKQAPRYPPMKPSNDTLSRNSEVPKVDAQKCRSLRSNGLSSSGGAAGATGQTPQEQQMEMFLRSSIRQSKKLRDLEKSPVPLQSRGVVNNAFEPEYPTPIPVVAAAELPPVPAAALPPMTCTMTPGVEAAQPTVDVTKLYDVTALQTALSRVIDYVGKDGSFDEGAEVKKVMKLLDTVEFQHCLAVTNIIKQILCSQAAPPSPVRSDAQQLYAEIADSGDIRNTAEGQELLTILGGVNMSELLSCHDRVSKIFGAPKNPPIVYPAHVLQAPASATSSRQQTIGGGAGVGINSSTTNGSLAVSGSNPLASPFGSSASQRRVIEPPPELAVLVDEGDHASVIHIDKTHDPLGATVRNEGESIIVGRIVKGGAAEKSGLLHEGDEIVAVNGIEMRGKTVAQVSDELAAMTGQLALLIIPNDRYLTSQHQQQQQQPQQHAGHPLAPGHHRQLGDGTSNPAAATQQSPPVMHIKAHFDYDPEDDMYIPCRELGIAFDKGDILHVINMDDPNWWQAYKDGEDENALAGLIPSKSFQLRREAIRQQLMGHTMADDRASQRRHRFLCTPTMTKRHSSASSLNKAARKNSKGKMYNAATQPDPEEPILYEEVGLYYPRANCKRPIVLIGPSNIGKHELRQRLMEDTARFAAAVPHTSRPRKDNETDGADYHFISRAQFENDIINGRFVEHGEYERNYYGTSLQAIRAVVLAGQICVLNLHPESLKILKRSDLKPYVIFIAPPSLEKLRQNRIRVGASVKTEELKEIIEKARDIEDKYGAYFDSVIINHEQERAYRELLKEIAFIEREPQWVPKQWLDFD